MRNRVRFGAGLALAVVMLATARPVQAGDDAGEQVFKRNCQACHTLVDGVHRVGPSLHGVVGRPSASVSGYIYSSAMKGAGLTWTEEQLNAFLANPQALIPNSKMSFLGLKDEAARAALIAFLKTR